MFQSLASPPLEVANFGQKQSAVSQTGLYFNKILTTIFLVSNESERRRGVRMREVGEIERERGVLVGIWSLSLSLSASLCANCMLSGLV